MFLTLTHGQRIVSDTFYETISFWFSELWHMFNSFTLPLVNLTPMQISFGVFGFVVVANVIKRILNNGDLHDTVSIAAGAARNYKPGDIKKAFKNRSKSYDLKNAKIKD